MRVAIVSTTYPPYVVGGAERSVQELARGLASDGHEVRVFCLGPEHLGNSIERDGSVEVRRFASPAFRPFETNGKNSSRFGKVKWHFQELGRFSAYLFLRAQFRAFNPDVVHTNNIAGFGWLAWKAAGTTPLVHTVRDYYLSCLTSTHWRNDSPCDPNYFPCRASKAPFRLGRRRPDLFVGISEDIVERHRAIGSIKTYERSLTIYNQPHLLTPSAPRIAHNQGDFIFGALGRLGADKGTWKVIEAFKTLPAEISGKRLQLRIAGNGTEEDVARIGEASRSDSRITYVGLSNPDDFYAEIDCAVVSTQWAEPFGRTAAEALVAGTALLASHTGGLPEVLGLYGGRGRLVNDYMDVSSWADAMTRVVDDLPADNPRSAQYLSSSTVDEQYLDAFASTQRVVTA